MTRDPARRAEWLLMYRQGLDAGDIARICHTLPQLVEEYLREQVQRDPSIFDTRLGRCLEPSLPVHRDEDATRGWEGNRLSLARFIDSHGRFPSRSADTSTPAGALEAFLYRWVRAQRAASAAGGLTSRQERQLEALPRWTVLGRDQLNARHWDDRLEACSDFITAHGRLPRYRGGKTERERSLGGWDDSTPECDVAPSPPPGRKIWATSCPPPRSRPKGGGVRPGYGAVFGRSANR